MVMELNREHIIKALERHADDQDCVNCPYTDTPECSTELAKDALSIIEELTVELEAMRTAANSYKMHNEKLNEENERLRAQVKMWTDTAYCENDRVNSIKADTVRKMAEKINASFHPDSDYSGHDVKRFIDQIAKEMLEG